MYRHAVVITPVARWVLIARGTAYSTRFPGSSVLKCEAWDFSLFCRSQSFC